MEEFLSIENLNLHKEYLRNQKLKYSVFEVCYPEIKDKDVFELLRIGKLAEKEKIIAAKTDIMLHDVYFESFGRRNQSSEAVRRQYRSEQSFLYELYEISLNSKEFSVVYMDRGNIKISSDSQLFRKNSKIIPVLAVDLCEHAYFLDYAFNKDEYLKNAISFLNLKKIDEKMLGKH